MSEQDIIEKISAVKTMPELDAMRLDVVAAMKNAGSERGEEGFKFVQEQFIKAKNRLTRIPLKDRTW